MDQDARVLLFILEKVVIPGILKPDRALFIHEQIHGDKGVIVALESQDVLERPEAVSGS